jgi:hypothetical protein
MLLGGIVLGYSLRHFVFSMAAGQQEECVNYVYLASGEREVGSVTAEVA